MRVSYEEHSEPRLTGKDGNESVGLGQRQLCVHMTFPKRPYPLT